MKKHPLIASICILLASCGTNPETNSPFISERGDSLIVDTTVPGAEVIGYKGQVPLQVVVLKGKIAEIRVLDNQETPRFLSRAKDGLLPCWEGKTIAKAAKTEVDAVTGATYTSNAIIRNMQIAFGELRKK